MFYLLPLSVLRKSQKDDLALRKTKSHYKAWKFDTNGVPYIGHASCHQQQPETNDYELAAAVTFNRSSEAASRNVEDPYHVTTDEVSAIRNVCVLHDHTVGPHHSYN